MATVAQTTASLLALVAARAEAEPEAVLPVLRVLAGETADAASGQADPQWVDAVREINRARVEADRAEFVAASWTAEQVAEHLGVQSRQAVAQRRARGGLLGAPIGTHTYYPTWQFGPDGVAAGLGRLLALLRAAGVGDARAADDILRMTHSTLPLGTLLETWRSGDWGLLGVWLGDIGGWHR